MWVLRKGGGGDEEGGGEAEGEAHGGRINYSVWRLWVEYEMDRCGLNIWFYCIDWSATGSMLSGIGAVLGAAAVILVADNYRKWIKREKYKKDRERAIEIASIYYEGESILHNIRAPFLSASEIKDGERALGDVPEGVSDAQLNKWTTRAVVLNRIQRHDDYWEKLFNILPVAKVMFGVSVHDALFDLILIRSKLYAAADAILYSPDGDLEVSQMLFRNWGGRDHKDEVQESLSKAKRVIDEMVVPYVSSP